MTGTGRRAVVAGVDGSAAAAPVARFAATEAAARDRDLQLVHVVPWPDPGAAATRYADRRWVEQLRRDAEELVARTADGVAATLPPERVRCTVAFGDPVAELVGAAAAAELVVVGPRGTGGVAGLVLGSTATDLAALAPCPVVVLPGSASAGGNAEVSPDGGSVVVGVACSRRDGPVLDFAAAEAALRGTDLLAVHTRPVPGCDPFDGTAAAGDEEAAEEEQRALAEALAGLREDHPDVRVVERLVRGRTAPALLAAAQGAQLLVVGRPHGPLLRRLGSAAHSALRRSACPVAVVPAGVVPAGVGVAGVGVVGVPAREARP